MRFLHIPSDDTYAWVAAVLAGVYLLLAVGSWLEARSRRRI